MGSATKNLSMLTLACVVAACSDGGGSNSGDDEVSLEGGAVKGPMAGAVVTAYALDLTVAGFKGAVIATGETDSAAQITGLNLPEDVATPFLLEFSSDADTIDVTTNALPVISTLRTVVTAEMLNAADSVYATPLTTVAVDLAIENADISNGIYQGNNDGSTTTEEYLAALSIAGDQVASGLGFGLLDDVNIFTTPPLINDVTDTVEEQTAVAAYRTAVEALTAVVHQLEQDAIAENAATSVTTDGLISALAIDMSDGEIDGAEDGTPLAEMAEVSDDVATRIVSDPTILLIPGTTSGVTDVETILATETQSTGVTTDTNDLLSGSIDVEPVAVATSLDTDGDTVADNSDNCPLAENTDQLDHDGDELGDHCDSDDDNDGVNDDNDAFPKDSSETADNDGDGTGDNADLDDDNDGVEDVNDAFPFDDSEQLDTDLDGTGNNADTDDDNDGVDDDNDAFPLNPEESVDTDGDTVGNNADDDDDGDGVSDDNDRFPLDANESRDQDGDGVGDNGDNCPTVANADQANDDGDNMGNACDTDNPAVWDQFNWGEALWQ